MSKILIQSLPLRVSPVQILEAFQDRPYVFLLDSSLKHRQWGRFSIIGFDPFDVVHGNSRQNWQALKKKFSQFNMKPHKTLPLQAGMVGFLSYDFGCALQEIKIKKNKEKNDPLGGFLFGFYDSLIIIDHFQNKINLVSTGLPERNSRLRTLKAKERLQTMMQRLQRLPKSQGKQRGYDQKIPALSIKSNFTKDKYIQTIRRALEFIRTGDIYQINLSQRVCLQRENAPWDISAVQLYKKLRQLSPSSFGAYFDCGASKILSSSPEQFLHLRDNLALIRPMKGTRPRMNQSHKDDNMRRELLKNPKEIAELLMVTDLERNDLGRVCEFGTVKVKRMRAIEKYNTVYQATSTIEGKLHKDKNCFDLLEATFPGGSVTGCPKLRAMEIIDALEPDPRGIYTGALGYMGFDGNCDFNILIRTLLLEPNMAHFHVGGGIVADSDPQKEYQETWIKAQAILKALDVKI